MVLTESRKPSSINEFKRIFIAYLYASLCDSNSISTCRFRK